MEAAKRKFKQYQPLVALLAVAFLGATALAYAMDQSIYGWMHFFMGLVLCQFAMLKLFHPIGFVEGFRKYDLVARVLPAYAYVYPYIELALGLAYLSFMYTIVTYIITIVVMGIGAIGVIRALRAGLNLKCACMGTVLDVPLSTVTLTEDIVMGLMACVMLAMEL